MHRDATEGGGLDDVGRTQFLAGAASAGETRHFDELFERVAPAVLAWLTLRVPRGGLDAQDLLQEVWLRALQSFGTYDPARSFRAWILGIAKNVLLQTLARPRQRSLDPGLSSASAPAVPDPATSIGRRFARDEALELFLARVERMPPDERALLIYCGLEQYSVPEAARRLGLGTEATSKRWQTLRARLRDDPAMNRIAASLLD